MEKETTFENIYLTLIENEKAKDNVDIESFFNELKNETFLTTNKIKNDNEFSEINYNKIDELYVTYCYYDINYTIQQLLIICEYYNITKPKKLKKTNKLNIIHNLIDFENDVKNSDIVIQRKTMWFYMNELKNDKFMKKYILW